MEKIYRLTIKNEIIFNSLNHEEMQIIRNGLFEDKIYDDTLVRLYSAANMSQMNNEDVFQGRKELLCSQETLDLIYNKTNLKKDEKNSFFEPEEEKEFVWDELVYADMPNRDASQDKEKDNRLRIKEINELKDTEIED